MYKKTAHWLLVGVLLFNLTGCGSILYPERKGQINGKIDPEVLLLDAAGLIFFIIPGVIALAIDFSNGTIYLPGGGKSQLSKDELISMQTENGKMDVGQVNKVVAKKTHHNYELEKSIYYPAG